MVAGLVASLEANINIYKNDKVDLIFDILAMEIDKTQLSKKKPKRNQLDAFK